MKKRIYTQEMLADLGNMTDRDFADKWGMNRVVVTRNRVNMGIKSFLPQSRAKRKIENGIEYKWCPRGGGHWGTLDEFKLSPTRLGGYRGVCHKHEREDAIKSYHANDGKGRAQKWRATEGAKNSLRRTWRVSKAKKNDAYVQWNRDDEVRAYKLFGGCCAYCGIEVPFSEIEFDHFIPIALGGKTEPKNMLPCCRVCNHGIGGKFDKEPIEWIHIRFAPSYIDRIIKNIYEKLEILSLCSSK